MTLLLVRNFTGVAGQDLDTNDDGVLDVTPWDAVVDSLSVGDGGGTDRAYSTVILGPAFAGIASTAPGGASRITNGQDTNTVADWMRNDFDGFGFPGFLGSAENNEARNTPGAVNVPVLGIGAIQGASHASPYVGQIVETVGVVTALRSNGFYLQSVTPSDSNAATSEGIFVFTGGAPTVLIGNLLRLQGTITEFRQNNDVNDKLFAGGGAAVILGGGGDDLLDGGTKRDILIGGVGKDVLLSQQGTDILIGGTTTFDGNLDALEAISNEWISTRTYAERITNIGGSGPGFGTLPRENGSFFLRPGVTVFDDGVRDEMTGSNGRDWYFANLSKDKLFDRTPAERLDATTTPPIP